MGQNWPLKQNGNPEFLLSRTEARIIKDRNGRRKSQIKQEDKLCIFLLMYGR
jgi:hypothetical protein